MGEKKIPHFELDHGIKLNTVQVKELGKIIIIKVTIVTTTTITGE
jgi:hypothetical protein